MVKLKWFGHSMWSVEKDEKKIIIDPFTDIGYPMPKNLTADIVISSHDHYDHNNFKLIIPPFQKITQIGTYQIQDIKVKLIEASHGRYNGKNLGDIYMILIIIDGLSVLHCGDLGTIPNEEVMAELDDIDILLIPIGGNYTINAEKALKFIDLCNAKYVFPMHYKTDKSTVEVETIDRFRSLVGKLEEINSDTFEIDPDEVRNSDNRRFFKLKYE